MKHTETIDAARVASEKLLSTNLAQEQQQLVVDMMNAVQALNTLYWDARREHEFTPIVKAYAEELYTRTEAAVLEWQRGIMPAASIAQVLGEQRAPSGYDYSGHDKHIEEVLTAEGFGYIPDALEAAAKAAQDDGLTTSAEVIYDLRARAKRMRSQ